jgi:hypothetical protein
VPTQLADSGGISVRLGFGDERDCRVHVRRLEGETDADGDSTAHIGPDFVEAAATQRPLPTGTRLYPSPSATAATNPRAVTSPEAPSVLSVEFDPVAEVEEQRRSDAESKNDENNDCDGAHTHALPCARRSEPKARTDPRTRPALTRLSTLISPSPGLVQVVAIGLSPGCHCLPEALPRAG